MKFPVHHLQPIINTTARLSINSTVLDGHEGDLEHTTQQPNTSAIHLSPQQPGVVQHRARIMQHDVSCVPADKSIGCL